MAVATTLNAAGAIPAGYRPGVNTNATCAIVVAGVTTMCNIAINTAGDVTISKGDGNFGIGDTVAFPSFLTYWGGSA
jgi:hypothetical protein